MTNYSCRASASPVAAGEIFIFIDKCEIGKTLKILENRAIFCYYLEDKLTTHVGCQPLLCPQEKRLISKLNIITYVK